MSDIVSSGFLNRNIVEYLMSDRSRQYRCNTLQNPLAYMRDGQLLPISIVDVANGYTDKAKGIYLRDKSIVSVGIKKADDPYKFVGFRPDEKQDGSEQFEMSLESLEINGKSQTINLSTKTVVAPVAYNLGLIIVRSTRQGSRLCLPLTNADDGFKISFRCHLTHGMRIEYRELLDEYWVYRSDGKFFLRLCKPILLDPTTGEPLFYEDEPGKYNNLVKHSLQDLGDGTFLYVKEPTEAFGKVELPENFLLDADTVYSSTADGYVYNASSGTWSTVHDAFGGTAVSNSSHYPYSMSTSYSGGPTILIFRSFFYYVLTGLSGTVTACSEFLYGYSQNGSTVMAQLGTQSATLAAADYNAFSGSSFGNTAAWSLTGYNEIAFNAGGISAAQTALGGTMKICNRESHTTMIT